MTTESEVRCWEDGCTEPAIAKKPHGVTADGTPVVTLVCYEHAQIGDAER